MKAIVLSSGGVDSTTCVSLAVQKHGTWNVSTVSVFYGQKHSKELSCASRVAQHFGLRHYVLDLSSALQYSNCPLLARSSEEIPHESYAEQISKNGAGMVPTYVPFRNGLMLSAVASLASSLYPGENVEIYIGAHADDAAGDAYADCSPEFTSDMARAIYRGTYGLVHLVAPLVNMNKAQVVETGLRLNTPYELTWSCYEGMESPCGSCGTCIDRAAAFAANGVPDPALS